MIRHDKPLFDHMDEQHDPATRAMLADLDRAYVSSPPPTLRAAIDRAVLARQAAPPPSLAPSRGHRPERARIVPPDPVTNLRTVFAATCHSAADVKDILKGGAQSLLAACQVSAPGVTADELVAALLAPDQPILAQAVADGQITAAQQASSLAALQTRLMAFVSTPGGRQG